MPKHRRYVLWLFFFVIALGFVHSSGRLNSGIPKWLWTSPEKTSQAVLIPQEMPTHPTRFVPKEELDLPAHALRVSYKAIGFPSQGIPVLMYHAISFLPGNSLGVSPEQFAEEMEYLDSHGFKTLSMEDLDNLYKDPYTTALPEHPVVLTFDDGYADNYQSAWPVMQKHGFTGTFFIVSKAVGSGMMTWENLKDLAQHGNSIGSHTVNHYDLTTLSAVQLEHELADSKSAIERKLGISVLALCYPSGRHDEQTQAMVSKTGYSLAFTTEPGRIKPSTHPLDLKRIRIPGGLTLKAFERLLN